jgi:hypothetical protein
LGISEFLNFEEKLCCVKSFVHFHESTIGGGRRRGKCASQRNLAATSFQRQVFHACCPSSHSLFQDFPDELATCIVFGKEPGVLGCACYRFLTNQERLRPCHQSLSDVRPLGLAGHMSTPHSSYIDTLCVRYSRCEKPVCSSYKDWPTTS